MNIPYECAIKTKYGIYKLKVTKDVKDFYSINASRKEIGVILNLGGKDKFCVQIKVPYEGNIGKILWVQSGKQNECSIDNKEQSGEKLIHMVHLGITIAKEVNATLKSLELEDNASFKCILPDGQSIAMSSTDHDLAFYQKSYYEKRYTAILIDEFVKERYYNDLKGFTDVSKKPVIFDFKSNEIEKELLPLYNSSTTWKEFFDKINDKYDNKKCTVISVWLKTALRYIMNNNIYSGLDWKIDITKIPTIRYEERVLLKTGGRRTLKHKKYVDEPMLPEILDMDWKTYFKQFRVEGV